jgi:hypothetical protein
MARKTSRFHPMPADISGAFDNGRSEVESLKDEMEEWSGNMEGANMEHLPKFEEVTEAKDALENALNTLEGIEVPEFLEGEDASYTNDTRTRESRTRGVRLQNALNALDAAKACAQNWLDENDELELTEAQPIDEDDPPAEDEDGDAEDPVAEEDVVTQEMVDERYEQREAAEQFINEMDDAMGELENVSFPGMY